MPCTLPVSLHSHAETGVCAWLSWCPGWGWERSSLLGCGLWLGFRLQLGTLGSPQNFLIADKDLQGMSLILLPRQEPCLQSFLMDFLSADRGHGLYGV